jgi:hypothetical protein
LADGEEHGEGEGEVVPSQFAQHDVFADEDGDDGQAHCHHCDPADKVDNGSLAVWQYDRRARHHLKHRYHTGQTLVEMFDVTFTSISVRRIVYEEESGHMR